MASSMITPDQDSVVTEIEIGAPPERVFQALISREQALQFADQPVKLQQPQQLL